MMNVDKPKPRVSTCRGCGAPIVWFETRTGRAMPVDASTVAPEDLVLDLPRHISHFATCPKADAFRRDGYAKKKGRK